MSEPVLKAILQLMAVSASIDGIVTQAEKDVIDEFLDENLSSDTKPVFVGLFDEYADVAVQSGISIEKIAKKINAELNHKQKIIVLIHILELVSADGTVGEAEEGVIDQLAISFNVDPEEYQDIKSFVTQSDFSNLRFNSILIVSNQHFSNKFKSIYKPDFSSIITFLRIQSIEMYMLKYFQGGCDSFLNGIRLRDRHIYSFSNGAAIRSDKINPIYYSDVVSNFLTDDPKSKITFEAKNIHYTFSGGKLGLRDVNIVEEGGRLMGIMGASGSGKSTLLNVLNGNSYPSNGEVTINGVNIHAEENKKLIEGVIGYVPQDDLLIEELTVYQNLYYSAKLCFGNFTEVQIEELVHKTLQSLGLTDIKHLKVGSPLKKTISGGQRKRVNIGLELLREPYVMFVDEPTSGLSSNDSENIMDLLKELTLKGKMIFVVIHQPSSDIFKMFDKLIIMDVGGFQIYYGNPIEAVSYFKREANLINSEQGFCPECGNINPEQIFSIIETKVVDEYGRYTDSRKMAPLEWNKIFKERITIEENNQDLEQPSINLKLPSKWKQFWLFAKRDISAKIANTQYMTINLLEAPLLAFILAYIVRYYHIDQSTTQPQVYLFGENMNLPAYIFMSIIVSLFIGLTVSAEEIIKDAKILKREAFLHLSRKSYLLSKIAILFAFSAIQSLSFVLIGNWILGISGLFWPYWWVMFSTSCFANLLGLNISSTFNSIITIYILIPILLIPQLILGGIVVKFENINPSLASENKVPIVSELMTSRWAFEALAVTQFKDNPFEKEFYPLDKRMALSDYKKTYYLPLLDSKLSYVQAHIKNENQEIQAIVRKDLDLLRRELNEEMKMNPQLAFTELNKINKGSFDPEVAKTTKDYIDALRKNYVKEFNEADKLKNRIIAKYVKTEKGRHDYLQRMQYFHNKSIEDLVRRDKEENRIVELNGKLIQKIYPVFLEPTDRVWYSWRSHFFAPNKNLLGYLTDTLIFNTLIIWVMVVILYILLYYNILRESLKAFSFISWSSKKKG